MSKYIINKELKDYTEVESMILSIKGAVEEIKKNPEHEEFFGAFIYITIIKLQELGISKDEIFKYRFI